MRVHLLCCRVDELEGILALGLDIGAIDEILQCECSHGDTLTQDEAGGLGALWVTISLRNHRYGVFSIA